MIIDGKNLILGRLATFAAKQALDGEEIIILNCEKIILTGRKKYLFQTFLEKQKLGDSPYHGPFYPKTPERIVRRTIRGMLSYKQERGKKAYKRIKCFKGIPQSYSDQKMETVQAADYSKLKTLNFITINDLSKIYGKGVA